MLAVLLSIRHDSLFIAVLGLLGGFATPALLSTGENRPIPLFTYLLLLNVGLAWVAFKKGWPVLTILTLVLTAIYQWGWVVKFLDASQLSLAMGIFLVFSVMSFVALILGRRGLERGGAAMRPASCSSGPALAASVMPLVFAIYLAAVPRSRATPALLFGFLLLHRRSVCSPSPWRAREELLHAVGALDDAARVRDLARARPTRAARWMMAIALHGGLRACSIALAPLVAERLQEAVRRRRGARDLRRAAAAVRVPGARAHRAGGGVAVGAVRRAVRAARADRVARAGDSRLDAVLRRRVLRAGRRGLVVGHASA